MLPRRSGAKNKHQTAKEQAYYEDVKRTRVDRDSRRGRTSRDAQ